MKTYTRNIFRDPDIGDTIKTDEGVLRVVRVVNNTYGRKVYVRVNGDTTHQRTITIQSWRAYEGDADVIVDGGKREGFTAS